MRGIKIPLQDFPLKMQGGFMCEGSYLWDTTILAHPITHYFPSVRQ